MNRMNPFANVDNSEQQADENVMNNVANNNLTAAGNDNANRGREPIPDRRRRYFRNSPSPLPLGSSPNSQHSDENEQANRRRLGRARNRARNRARRNPYGYVLAVDHAANHDGPLHNILNYHFRRVGLIEYNGLFYFRPLTPIETLRHLSSDLEAARNRMEVLSHNLNELIRRMCQEHAAENENMRAENENMRAEEDNINAADDDDPNRLIGDAVFDDVN